MQSFEIDKSDLQRIKAALDGDDAGLEKILMEYHASEVAIIFEQLSQEAKEKIIALLPADFGSEVITEMSGEHHPEDILISLDPEKRSEIVKELDYDVATDIISQMDEDDQLEILNDIDPQDATNIRALLTYDKDTAGGRMNTDVLKVTMSMNKKQALDEIISQSEEREELYTIFAINDDNVLQGIVSVKSIVKARPDVLIKDLVNKDFIYVEADVDQEEVARLISQYNLSVIPVVDSGMKMLGFITFDDILDVLQEENTEDILKISGVSEDEELSGNWQDAVKSRLPWLIINLATAFLAASIIRSFDDTVARLSVISAYMVIVAGMGGNAATQALAVTIRRISLSDLNDRQTYNTLLKELLVGMINGAASGVIVFLVALFYDGNPMLGLVIFLAMTCNLLVAGITGSGIPMILKRLNVDPAVASSIIITTFTDCFGFLLPLWLASMLLL